MFRNADDKARARLRGQLDMPLDSEDPDEIEDGVWGEDAMGSAFEQAEAAADTQE